jgi:hypothetical protein
MRGEAAKTNGDKQRGLLEAGLSLIAGAARKAGGYLLKKALGIQEAPTNRRDW